METLRQLKDLEIDCFKKKVFQVASHGDCGIQRDSHLGEPRTCPLHRIFLCSVFVLRPRPLCSPSQRNEFSFSLQKYIISNTLNALELK